MSQSPTTESVSGQTVLVLFASLWEFEGKSGVSVTYCDTSDIETTETRTGMDAVTSSVPSDMWRGIAGQAPFFATPTYRTKITRDDKGKKHRELILADFRNIRPLSLSLMEAF